MPKYDAECPVCGQVTEYICSVAECSKTPECCGIPMKKVTLTAPKGFITGKFDAFRSPVDGTLITGSRALAEHNKRNDVVSLADGYSDAKVKAGDFGNTPPSSERLKRELKQDIASAYMDVKSGYKPIVEVQNDD